MKSKKAGKQTKL